jgi:hypothetical protein
MALFNSNQQVVCLWRYLMFSFTYISQADFRSSHVKWMPLAWSMTTCLTRYVDAFISMGYMTLHSKKIVFFMKPLPRWRIFEVSYDFSEPKNYSEIFFETSLGSEKSYETPKVLHLGTGFVKTVFFDSVLTFK